MSDTDEVISAINNLAHAIAADAMPGKDASGGTVASLTEAIMGVTAGLFAIADAIREQSERQD